MASPLKKFFYWCAIFICVIICFFYFSELTIFNSLNQISSVTNSLVINEDSNYQGLFTYKNNISTNLKNFEVKIFYKTNTEVNTYEIILDNNQVLKGNFSKDKNVVKVEINDRNFEKFTINTYYEGKGDFNIKSITISPINKHIFVSLVGCLIVCIFILYLTYDKINKHYYDKIFKKISGKGSKKTVIFIIFLTIYVCYPLLNNNLYNGADLTYHLSRIESIYQGLLDNEFPIRIHSFYLDNYGYANGIFYPDIFLYIPAFLCILGISLINSYKLFIIFCSFMASCTMYISVKKISNLKIAAIVSTILYTMAPYNIINIYERAALGEIQSMVFIPLVIWGIYELIYGYSKKIWPFTVGIIGVFFSHMITSVFIGIIAIIMCGFNLKKIFAEKRLKNIILSGLLILAITIFIWLPIIEQFVSNNFVLTDAPWSKNFDIVGKSTTVSQLFSLKIHQENWNPFIGLPLLIISALRLLIDKTTGVLYKFMDTCLWIGGLTLIATTTIFPWEVFQEVLGSIQFPWRLLVIATPFLSMSAGLIISYLKLDDDFKKVYFLMIIVLCILTVSPLLDRYYMDAKGTPVMDSYSVGMGEYLPLGTSVEEIKLRGGILQTNNETFIIENIKRSGTEIEFDVSGYPMKSSYIEAPLLYYKGYAATITNDEGKIHPLEVEIGDNNITKIIFKEYTNGRVNIKYLGTTVQKISLVISLGIIFCIVIKKIFKLNMN